MMFTFLNVDTIDNCTQEWLLTLLEDLANMIFRKRTCIQRSGFVASDGGWCMQPC